ncbi:HWE histidine kinase domain-containing protein [Luteimonas sp. 3794]|uniref:sensor histidine kinase n=1 Tax=Luteimonas sp. 3794 TaxID=2817730 RepID=UPI00285D92FB|nr:HWE histidine kinase domain-containing protein [Luteimonas sp. 3794]MDR6992921.1 PAS domain S-box-containing protein [Luteimonas sp. 3794]
MQLAQPRDPATLRAYEALLQATPDLLYVFDLEHRFVYANDALLNMWGMRWEEAAGKTCLELGYEPWHAAMHDEEIERVIATRAPIRGDVPFRHHAKGMRIYDYIFTPVIGADGTVEAIAGTTRDVTDRRMHEEQLELLVNELNHRVKNTLSTVQSLVRQTLGTADDLQDGGARIESRLLALSRAHDVLTRENWHSADMQDIVKGVIAPYEATPGARFKMSGPVCRLTPQRALALAMALHELASNAVKYGALSQDGGEVHISWDCTDADEGAAMAFTWRESGGPEVQPPTRRGFGLRLLERGLRNDLGGDVELAYAPDGVVFRATAPLETAPVEGAMPEMEHR